MPSKLNSPTSNIFSSVDPSFPTDLKQGQHSHVICFGLVLAAFATSIKTFTGKWRTEWSQKIPFQTNVYMSSYFKAPYSTVWQSVI